MADYKEMYEAAEAPEQLEAWRIDNDNLADWAVRKIKEEQAENRRLHDIAEEERAAIDAKIDSADRRFETRTRFLTAKLAEYFQTVPHKETKTQEQYQLLSGRLVFTKPKPTFEKDDAALLSYLKLAGYMGFVQTVEKPAWGEFKKGLQIIDGKAVVADTGEVLPDAAVRVVDAPEKFEVK